MTLDRKGLPPMERRPIYLRAFASPAGAEANMRKSARQAKGRARIGRYTVIFDCETTTDETQRLRFGAYQVRDQGHLKEQGWFYAADILNSELAALQAAAINGRKLRPVAEFVHYVLFDFGYHAEAMIVGFNLPFDLSRVAVGYESARAVCRGSKVDRSFVGGFSFKLSRAKDHPNIRVKQLSRRAAFINFAAGGEGGAPSRGLFLDVKTLAAALTARSFSLDGLAEYLGVARKVEFDRFDQVIDAEFIAYAAQDVETTWLCYERLLNQYQALGLQKPVTSIYSEASLGKAYLTQMGVQPWLSVERSFSPATTGKSMSTYYGGRAEIHIRRRVTETRYCDFASMYPTVCILMGLWSFVIANGVVEEDATEEARRLLDAVQLTDLRSPSFWRALTMLVEVEPDEDIFPVRARYGDGPTQTIGVNYLTSGRSLWFTLADCVASTLLCGKPPKVVSAIRFRPNGVQSGLGPVNVAGTSHVVDPSQDDFYARLINIRRTVKSDMAKAKAMGAPASEITRLDAEQMALKICANATSYGVFIELNVEPADDGAEVAVHGANEAFIAASPKTEAPGSFFHPLLGTLITGAARLMLATTERLALDKGVDWLLCDTDSMAFARPETMSREVFRALTDEVCQWFEALNPYEGGGSLLEVEGENYAVGRGDTKAEEPLFGYAVSAKRYCLFNIASDGEIIIRKASAHGLGHLIAPYQDPIGKGVRESGVALWQEDLWKAIIRAELDGRPHAVALDWPPALDGWAASQNSISTPAMARGFATYNRGKPYADQVKPFNFTLAFFGRRPAEQVWMTGDVERYDPRGATPKPIAPYRREPGALDGSEIFDRETGEHVPASALRTYREVLRTYPYSPETKFLGGRPLDAGQLRRRHVFAETVFYIGKEADGFEETGRAGEAAGHVAFYGAAPENRRAMLDVIAQVPLAKLKAAARVGHGLIGRVLAGDAGVSLATVEKLHGAAIGLLRKREEERARDLQLRRWAQDRIAETSLASFARRVGSDPSNLRRALKVTPLPRKLSRRLWGLRVGSSNCTPLFFEGAALDSVTG